MVFACEVNSAEAEALSLPLVGVIKYYSLSGLLPASPIVVPDDSAASSPPT